MTAAATETRPRHDRPRLAALSLLGLTVIWGSTFLVVKDAVERFLRPQPRMRPANATPPASTTGAAIPRARSSAAAISSRPGAVIANRESVCS